MSSSVRAQVDPLEARIRYIVDAQLATGLGMGVMAGDVFVQWILGSTIAADDRSAAVLPWETSEKLYLDLEHGTIPEGGSRWRQLEEEGWSASSHSKGMLELPAELTFDGLVRTVHKLLVGAGVDPHDAAPYPGVDDFDRSPDDPRYWTPVGLVARSEVSFDSADTKSARLRRNSLRIESLDGQPYDEDPLVVTASLADLLLNAARIGLLRNERLPNDVRTHVTYSSLLAGLLVATDAYAEWLAGEVDGEARIAAILAKDAVEAPDRASVRDLIGAMDPPDLVLSASAAELITLARRLRDEAEATTLDVRHIALAFILGIHHQDDLKRYGIDIRLWSNNHGGWLAAYQPDEVDQWRKEHRRRFEAEPNPVRLARGRFWSGFHADQPSVTDPDGRPIDLLAGDSLEIEPHVRALALLIASVNLRPPLAVGLFGDWGAGKTYFIRALRQEIQRLQAQTVHSGGDEREVGVYTRIAHVEFNAWHYVDDELWASLADKIFADLLGGDPKRGAGASARGRVLLTEVEKKRAEHEQEAARARRELEELRREHARSVTSRDVFEEAVSVALSREDVDRLRRSGAGPMIEELDEAQTAAKKARKAALDAKATLARGSATVNLLRGRFGSALAWVAGLTLLAVPVLTLIVASAPDPQLDAAARAIRAGTTFLSGAAAFVMLAVGASRRAIHRLDDLARQLDARIERHPKVAAAREQVRKIDRELEQARLKEADARLEVERLRRDSRGADRTLHDFLIDRANSDEYRGRLGVAASIRRDFESLTELIDNYNKDLSPTTGSGRAVTGSEHGDAAEDHVGLEDKVGDLPEHLVSRIVLYIDDLDRCAPDQVVQVLQAVHLLLAFPLFVVVVAVDARWLSQSLLKHYGKLLGPDGATPHDYLEKIFQIPLWLRPMSESGTRKLLTSLTEPVTDPEAPQPDVNQHGSGVERPRADPADTDPSGAPAQIDDEGRQPGSVSPVETRGQQLTENQADDLRLQAIEITDHERNFMMDVLGPLLGRSPRSLNRFVNVYRLMKAVQVSRRQPPDHDREAEEVTMLLLAIVTGLPSAASVVAPALRRVDRSRTLEELITSLQRQEPPEATHDEQPPSKTASNEQRDAQADRPRLRDEQRKPKATGHVSSDGRVVDELAQLQAWLTANTDWAHRTIAGWDRVMSRIARYSYRL